MLRWSNTVVPLFLAGKLNAKTGSQSGFKQCVQYGQCIYARYPIRHRLIDWVKFLHFPLDGLSVLAPFFAIEMQQIQTGWDERSVISRPDMLLKLA